MKNTLPVCFSLFPVTYIWILWMNRWPKIKLGANMPARAELTARKNDLEPQLIGEPTGEYYDVVLYFGIIDILQDYDISKKLEHAYKSFQYDPTSISAVDPRQYSRRFKDFIYKAFQEDRLDSWKCVEAQETSASRCIWTLNCSKKDQAVTPCKMQLGTLLVCCQLYVWNGWQLQWKWSWW